MWTVRGAGIILVLLYRDVDNIFKGIIRHHVNGATTWGTADAWEVGHFARYVVGTTNSTHFRILLVLHEGSTLDGIDCTLLHATCLLVDINRRLIVVGLGDARAIFRRTLHCIVRPRNIKYRHFYVVNDLLLRTSFLLY